MKFGGLVVALGVLCAVAPCAKAGSCHSIFQDVVAAGVAPSVRAVARPVDADPAFDAPRVTITQGTALVPSCRHGLQAGPFFPAGQLVRPLRRLELQGRTFVLAVDRDGLLVAFDPDWLAEIPPERALVFAAPGASIELCSAAGCRADGDVRLAGRDGYLTAPSSPTLEAVGRGEPVAAEELCASLEAAAYRAVTHPPTAPAEATVKPAACAGGAPEGPLPIRVVTTAGAASLPAHRPMSLVVRDGITTALALSEDMRDAFVDPDGGVAVGRSPTCVDVAKRPGIAANPGVASDLVVEFFEGTTKPLDARRVRDDEALVSTPFLYWRDGFEVRPEVGVLHLHVGCSDGRPVQANGLTLDHPRLSALWTVRSEEVVERFADDLAGYSVDSEGWITRVGLANGIADVIKDERKYALWRRLLATLFDERVEGAAVPPEELAALTVAGAFAVDVEAARPPPALEFAAPPPRKSSP